MNIDPVWLTTKKRERERASRLLTENFNAELRGNCANTQNMTHLGYVSVQLNLSGSF
jgi:hydroxyethylthiazole kinase-like sugar kinase family protein